MQLDSKQSTPASSVWLALIQSLLYTLVQCFTYGRPMDPLWTPYGPPMDPLYEFYVDPRVRLPDVWSCVLCSQMKKIGFEQVWSPHAEYTSVG